MPHQLLIQPKGGGFLTEKAPEFVRAMPTLAPVRLNSEHSLFIRTWDAVGSLVIRVNYRLYSPELDQEIEGTFIANGTTGNRSTEYWPLALEPTFRRTFRTAYRARSMYLLSYQVFLDSGTARRGQTFVQAGFVQNVGGTPVAHILFADYLTQANVLAFPGSPIRQSIEGPGMLRVVPGADPAAGAEIADAVPTNARWRFRAARFRLVTANVAGAVRRVQLYFANAAATTFALFSCPDTHADNATFDYTAAWLGGDKGAPSLAPIGTQLWINTAEKLDLFQGDTINTSTLNLNAADNYGIPQYLVEEHIED